MPDQRLIDRFNTLMLEIDSITANKRRVPHFSNLYCVDEEKLLEWRVKAKHIISATCGSESEHYKAFSGTENPRGMQFGNFNMARNLRAVFAAAREDYTGDYTQAKCELPTVD